MPISRYRPVILAERVRAARSGKKREGRRKKKACSSLVTASMNEKQLGGMLHYHPIRDAGGGGEPVAGLSSRRILCEGGREAGGKVGGCGPGPQTFSSPTHQTLHFLVCLGQASFLSAINLQHRPPVFIPFTLCLLHLLFCLP